MDVLMICIFVLSGLLVGFFIAYSVTTKSIIQDQEKQIARQNTEILRLQAKLHRATCRKAPEVIEIHDKTVDPENVPDCGRKMEVDHVEK